jgi:hypothetical protein
MRGAMAVLGKPILSILVLLAGCGASDGKGPDDHTVPPGDGALSGVLQDGSVGPLDGGSDAMRDAGGPSADAAVDGALPADSCNVAAPTECPTPAPTYATVAPIFKERCVVCHSPTWSGPWPLDSYRHISDWKEDVRSMLLLCTMPPPDAGVPMTREERLTILTWIRCNMPM